MWFDYGFLTTAFDIPTFTMNFLSWIQIRLIRSSINMAPIDET